MFNVCFQVGGLGERGKTMFAYFKVFFFFFFGLGSTITDPTWQAIGTPRSSLVVEGQWDFHLQYTCGFELITFLGSQGLKQLFHFSTSNLYV
jgi:hypothetical protein